MVQFGSGSTLSDLNWHDLARIRRGNIGVLSWEMQQCGGEMWGITTQKLIWRLSLFYFIGTPFMPLNHKLIQFPTYLKTLNRSILTLINTSKKIKIARQIPKAFQVKLFLLTISPNEWYWILKRFAHNKSENMIDILFLWQQTWPVHCFSIKLILYVTQASILVYVSKAYSNARMHDI